MSAHGFICVGGPLDGQWQPQRDRQTSFEVVETPDPSVLQDIYQDLYGVGALPVEHSYKHLRYVLQEHPVHGAAWVHQP